MNFEKESPKKKFASTRNWQKLRLMGMTIDTKVLSNREIISWEFIQQEITQMLSG